MASGTIFNVFDNRATNRYRIRFQVFPQDALVYNIIVYVGRVGNFTERVLINQGVSGFTWHGVDQEVDLYSTDGRHMHINVQTNQSYVPEAPTLFYMRNLRVEKMIHAEVQDSDIVGRRFYEGTKMSATDINVDSPDTIDGGPVITVNTVASTTPSSNPIGTSLGASGPAVTITQQQQTGQA